MLTAAGPYAEAAHIQPLGMPHNGPDQISNMLCLCPNHHVMFDLGGFVIDETGAILNPRTKAVLGVLSVDPEHRLDPERIAYHRRMFVGDRVDPF